MCSFSREFHLLSLGDLKAAIHPQVHYHPLMGCFTITTERNQHNNICVFLSPPSSPLNFDKQLLHMFIHTIFPNKLQFRENNFSFHSWNWYFWNKSWEENLVTHKLDISLWACQSPPVSYSINHREEMNTTPIMYKKNFVYLYLFKLNSSMITSIVAM